MKFRMIDQILAWEANRSIRGVKSVSFEEYSMRAPLGERECLPESLVLGGFCQLASWLVVLSSKFADMGQMAGLERVAFGSSLGPGERMSISVRVRGSEEGMTFFDGVGQAGSRPVLQVEGLQLVHVPLEKYQDANDLRVLFSEIHRPTQGELT